MGTSGARTGYKIFSINTTIRNPKRNFDFLDAFRKFDGKVMDSTNLYNYFFELVKRGIYQFTNIPQAVKDKLDLDLELTPQEVREAINDNPQATGLSGRVMTQLRALKDLSLLEFEETGNRRLDRVIKISRLGHELLNNPENAPNIYTKIMLGIQANNPCRVNQLNESRPFLNTLFVINRVNKEWEKLGHEPKGILLHEFAVFVLSMKDCDYKKAADEIIKYRKQYRYEIFKPYLQKYLEENDILPLEWKSVVRDYPDEVFRKFEMTGLVIKHGKFSYTYINYSSYNLQKVMSILESYKDYKYINFSNANEYYNFQQDISLPWEKSDIIRRQIIKAKATVLNITIDASLTLEQQEAMLDRIFFNQALSKAVARYDDKLILKELLILSGTERGKSSFDDISEPLRLEYLLALALGKKYGTKGLVSNIIYNEDGLPLHCAPSSKCDVIYHHQDGSYILEPTMQRGRLSQMNSETTNVVRHVKDEEKRTGLSYRVMMVAPNIHPDVVDFFQYKHSRENVKIVSINIDWIVNLFFESSTVIEMNSNYDSTLHESEILSNTEFADKVNGYKFDLNRLGSSASN